MYNAYVELQLADDKQPVKFKIYSDIFCEEYNIRFHKPKKDLCDKCELNTKFPQDRSEKEREDYEKHLKSKGETRQERENDKNIESMETLVLDFDLENVFSLPKAEVSSFFYKSKLNTYNLTAIVQQTKRPYSAVWTEVMSGRKGNDIASALVCILAMVAEDHPSCKDMIIWSDSCVPQNRNSCMAYALQQFLEVNPRMQSITQKFCEPGHSSIQDIDSFHSTIERYLKDKTVFSPVTLIKHLLLVRAPKGHRVKQMKASDFKDYQSLAKGGSYDLVKFASAKALKYHKECISKVGIKMSFGDNDFKWYCVINQVSTRRGNVTVNSVTQEPKNQQRLYKLPEHKAKDIKTMLPFMPAVDRAYMQSVISSQ